MQCVLEQPHHSISWKFLIDSYGVVYEVMVVHTMWIEKQEILTITQHSIKLY